MLVITIEKGGVFLVWAGVPGPRLQKKMYANLKASS